MKKFRAQSIGSKCGDLHLSRNEEGFLKELTLKLTGKDEQE